MSGGEEGGFLSRWSRRKRAAAQEPAADAGPARPPGDPAAPPPLPPPLPAPAASGGALPVAMPAVAMPAGAVPPGEAPPAEADRRRAEEAAGPPIDLSSLPRIEELTTESDLGAFLRPGVPQALRAAALRRMWSLDPAVRDFINCVDYQWDFNTPGGLPFGFANELGGDVAKLLAQAIGKLEEPGPEAPAEATAAAPAGDPAGMAPEGQGAGAALDTPGAAGAAPAMESAEAAARLAAALPSAPSAGWTLDAGPADRVPAALPEPAPGAPARRRHGGALPG